MQVNPIIPTADQIAALFGAPDDNSDLPPVPQTGPYGAPSVTMGPLAAALSGGMPGLSPQAPPPPAVAPQPAPPPQDQQSPNFLQMLADGLRGTPVPRSRVDPSTGQFLPPAPTGANATVEPAVANANALPSPTTVASSDSDTSGEDATTQSYRALHDQQLAHYDQAMAAAQRAVAAGKDPSGFIKIANDAAAVAERISEASIKHNEPAADAYTSQTLPNGQIVPFNKSTGTYGTPYGTPTVPPRPVTADERATYGLPDEGAFTIAPGEAPKAITGAAAQTPKLDAPTIDYLAHRINLGDNTAVTSLGFGSATDKAAVLRRAAELSAAGGMDADAAARAQIGAQVGLGGEKQGARTIGALGGRISTFSEEANQTSELALQASDAVPRGKWVPVNQIEQMGQAAASDPQLSAFQAANGSFANTYAKAVNPSGVLSDDARHYALSQLNVAKSPEAYEATVRQLQKEIRAVQSGVAISSQRQLDSVRGGAPLPPVRIQSDADYAKVPSGASYVSPDGQTRVKR